VNPGSRHAGIILPLFSARSSASWGIGEIPDIEPLSAWMSEARLNRLMLLPLGTMQPGQTSPYSAASTLAIDPIYIALGRVPEFERAGGTAALSDSVRRDLDAVRRSRPVSYDAVRQIKEEALSAAFGVFLTEEWERLTVRASALAGYIARERWWLDDYALFEAISRSRLRASWRTWPGPIRDRHPQALDEVRRDLSREVLRQQYWQWLAEEQWKDARRAAAEHGVALWGDLPFVAGIDSADVWSRAGEFMLDVSVGVPPDAFSATGQDWGLPAYRWDLIKRNDCAWIRLRARRMVALFDGVRVDHTVGLYRTYGRPPEGDPFFNPADEADQVNQGATVLRILRDAGMGLIAEDLGVVPDFVRASLARLGVPGCKVLRWERAWHDEAQPFIDPATFSDVSAAMTGTHDTEPLALWWETSLEAERAALLQLPDFHARGLTDPDAPWTAALRDALLALAYRARSNDLFLPLQDVFGWRDRINTPGTVGDANWTWTLPWETDRLIQIPEAHDRARFLGHLAAEFRRGPRH
jgi:4-alpha-glucanotransferase